MARALQSEPALQIDGALSAEELEDMFTDLSERIDAKVASKHGASMFASVLFFQCARHAAIHSLFSFFCTPTHSLLVLGSDQNCSQSFAGVTEQSIADACAEFASDDEVSVKLGNLASMQAAFFDKSESGASFQVLYRPLNLSGRVYTMGKS